jgi:hypothetical protein
MLQEISTLKWYTLYAKNKKSLLTILAMTARPINIKFYEKFIVNNRMLLFVSLFFYKYLNY